MLFGSSLFPVGGSSLFPAGKCYGFFSGRKKRQIKIVRKMMMFHSPPEPFSPKQPQKGFLSAVLERMAPHHGPPWNTTFLKILRSQYH